MANASLLVSVLLALLGPCPDHSCLLCCLCTQNFSACTCAGFTAVDVLGHGVMGHVIGTATILSLRVCSTALVSAHVTILCI